MNIIEPFKRYDIKYTYFKFQKRINNILKGYVDTDSRLFIRKKCRFPIGVLTDIKYFMKEC